MSKEERFEQVYNQINIENSDEMEEARNEAKVENRYNMLILAIIVVIDIILMCLFYKLTNTFSGEIISLLVVISGIIFPIIKHRGGKSKIEKYEKDYKEIVISKMVKSFNKELEFTPSKRYC